jgi:hypothetical protein
LDLDTFIVTMFCLTDDNLSALTAAQPLRQRGPQPKLADSEVLTIEIIGEFLGLTQDSSIFTYFRRHFAHFFPALSLVHRTTFVRQSANLWKVKEALWQRLLEQSAGDPNLGIIDGFPVAVCKFARAPRCKGFRGVATFGKDHTIKQTFYGLRFHVRVCWPGLITRLIIAPAHQSDLAVAEELLTDSVGCCLADRNYWKPELQQAKRQEGVEMLVPFKKASRDPYPERSRYWSGVRYRIETVFSQLVERFQVRRVWARDLWHLSSRVMRKGLSHTAAILVNPAAGNSPLRLAELLTHSLAHRVTRP